MALGLISSDLTSELRRDPMLSAAKLRLNPGFNPIEILITAGLGYQHGLIKAGLAGVARSAGYHIRISG